MKRRLLAVMCLLALVVSVFAFGIRANAATNYLVGYSIKDINPWLDPNDHSKGIIQDVTMKGNGSNDLSRYATYIHDDDGDGNVTYTYDGTNANKGTMTSWTPDEDGGDGIYATTIAITDSKGTTVLFVTIDCLGAYSGLLSDARTAIQEALGTDVIKKDNIIMSGSHTHSSFNFNSAELFRGENATHGEYYDYVISQIAASAVEAYADRASATMSKGSRDAGTVAQSNGTRYQLNFIRHYQRESYDAFDYMTDGTKVTFDTPYEIDFVQGSNFGTINGLRRYIANAEGLDEAIPVTGQKYGVIFDTVGGVDGYKASYLATADDMMHLIKFDFGTGSGKQPIVMLNWRAHTTENSNDFWGAVSSDYVGPLRAMMKEAGYRMSFFLGGAGDLIINQFNSNDPADTPWRNLINKTNGVATESDTNAYGRALYTVAVACLSDNMSTKTPGDILTSVSSFEYNRQVDSEGLRAALAALMVDHPDDYNTNWDHYPYYYEHADGKTYIINSYHHANGIKGRLNNTEGDTYTMPITAVTLGKAAAFVTAPFEIADRYDADNPLDNSLNDWLDLGTQGGFGTPFVLSCSNGYSGYIPYSTEYIYNTEEYATKTGKNANAMSVFGAGTYEANISPAAQDTGSQMVAHMLGMLKSHNTATKTAYCEHCKENVTWMPFDNDTIAWQYDGHYYLTEDVVDAPKITVYQDRSVCLDLNGKTYGAKGMAFHTYSNGPVLSIMDSVGTGKVIGHSRIGYATTDSTQYRGGTMVASSGSTINIYGGTFSFEKIVQTGELTPEESAVPVSQGGVALALGTINMYGGKIVGADLEVTDWVNASGALPENNGYGAAVYVVGTMNVSGGTITAGTVPASGEGRCVVLSSANSVLNLSGDAVIDEVMLMNISYRKQLIVTGEFTGSAAVALGQDIAYAGTIGNSIGAHVNGVIKVNAMPYVTYGAEDPNTPIYSSVVLAPDVNPVEQFGNKTLLYIRGPKGKACEACGASLVEWQPVYNTTRIPSDASGHYYLAENITAENGIRIIAEKDQTICLDLNGKTYEVNDTAIHPYQYGTINVMDNTTDKAGQITSHPGTQTTGGVMLLSANSAVNIYAGTYSYVPTDSAPTGVISGGVAYINNTGVLNLYGGELVGAEVISPTGTTVSTPGLGGAVTVLYGGKLNVAGGKISSGETPTSRGECVYMAAKGSMLELSGNAELEKIYANWSTSAMITVTGAFTGHADLFFNTTNAPLSNGMVIGTVASGVEVSGGHIVCSNTGNYIVKSSGTNLILSTDKGAAIYNGTEEPVYYATLAAAIQDYTGGYISLTKAVSDAVTVDKDVYLDLNGCNITGNLTVADGVTLYCMDSATDDYTVSDGIYGKISSYTGTVKGLRYTDGTFNKDYLTVTESGLTSFHRVNLELTDMTFMPDDVGMKYKCEFEGDEVVKSKVAKYGIALSVYAAPTAENLDTLCGYSYFTDFQAGAGANGKSSGTVLKGIMKDTNTPKVNINNVKRSVHGAAYVLTTEGEYLFGEVESHTYMEMLEKVDAVYPSLNTTAQSATLAMYKKFASVMQYWNLPNMIAAAAK